MQPGKIPKCKPELNLMEKNLMKKSLMKTKPCWKCDCLLKPAETTFCITEFVEYEQQF